jgi:hypothetical protein
MDLSSGTSSLPVVGLSIEPLPEFETSTSSKGISDVVIVSSQKNVYATYQS